ncbi:hypothetical protein [Pseudomonas guariconensis]|uniref:hypothetical protein n=1 Tax=Pseudomonas guariconensis TaxID=1288410 RepID=UPI0018AB9148|nr:hypothetical protein [Pseudomonas guariconensis]MBF8742088.1 hypothetical protein [Pseudomonas guariconensis]MBF8751084.1 hypothetical protein [Pseudomonas guariconensis]
MEKHVISLERQNLSELEVVERLVSAIGDEAFEREAQRLADLHTIDPHATIQSISLWVHPTLIGMSEGLFQILGRVCDQLVEREPMLLERPSYRYRNSHYTALPWTLWLDIVRYAREQYDPAALDAAFLAEKQRQGMSNRASFEALIATKRDKK